MTNNTSELETLSAKVDKERAKSIQHLAEKYDTSKSEVLRQLLDNGLRAHKYYAEFEIQP